MSQFGEHVREELLELDIASRQGVTIVELRGTVDVSSIGELNETFDRLLGSGRRRLVVDLADVLFVDSTMLGALVFTQRRLRSSGGELVVAGASAEVRRVFDITGLDRSLKLVETVEAGLDLLALPLAGSSS